MSYSTLFDFFVCQLIDRYTQIVIGRSIGQLVDTKHKIMIDNRDLVFGEHNVELDHLSATIVGLAERFDCVLDKCSIGQRFGVECLAHAAMTDGYTRSVEVIVVVFGNQRVARVLCARNEQDLSFQCADYLIGIQQRYVEVVNERVLDQSFAYFEVASGYYFLAHSVVVVNLVKI